MLLRHEKIKSSQLEMEQHIVKNLKSLTREKALIAAGQKEVADLTAGLKARLEITAQQMEKQGEIQGDSHEEILRDLAKIRAQVCHRRRGVSCFGCLLGVSILLRLSFFPFGRRMR